MILKIENALEDDKFQDIVRKMYSKENTGKFDYKTLCGYHKIIYYGTLLNKHIILVPY